MTKEELEIDNKRLDFNEKVQFVVKKEELKEQDIRLNRLCFDYQEKEKRIAELEKENAELKEQIGDVIECFTSSSIGDDFEMAESAREVMEVLNMQCYRHGKVKSKLTEAKEIINTFLGFAEAFGYSPSMDKFISEAKQFLKESE